MPRCWCCKACSSSSSSSARPSTAASRSSIPTSGKGASDGRDRHRRLGRAPRHPCRRHPRVHPLHLRQPGRDDHRALRPYQSRPRRHARLRRDDGLCRRRHEQLPLARRPRGHGDRRDLRLRPWLDLQMAEGQRYRDRHRHDAVRPGARLLFRQAVHSAGSAASTGNSTRLLVQPAANPGGVEHQRAVPPRSRPRLRSLVGVQEYPRRSRPARRRRQYGCSAGNGHRSGSRATARHRRRRFAGGDRRRLSVALLSRLLERGHFLRSRPDGRGPRHLRQMESDRLLPCRPALRRRRRARTGVAIGRGERGLLSLLCRPLRAHPRHHDRDLFADTFARRCARGAFPDKVA
ncbi:hypothetical protein RHECNPAF_9300164 [Rhizobium etli CNPAF512]|nr:hypothetical protein RHECNPAF_9300164 [Rhizobium etli CNPAF512]